MRYFRPNKVRPYSEIGEIKRDYYRVLEHDYELYTLFTALSLLLGQHENSYSKNWLEPLDSDKMH